MGCKGVHQDCYYRIVVMFDEKPAIDGGIADLVAGVQTWRRRRRRRRRRERRWRNREDGTVP